MTNFEKITQNEKAFVDFISSDTEFQKMCNFKKCRKFNGICSDCIMQWLKQQAEESAE